VRHPCRTPHGLFPAKAPVLGAANGIQSVPAAGFLRYCMVLIVYSNIQKHVIPAGIAGIQNTGM
jgi:hypothetical protein